MIDIRNFDAVIFDMDGLLLDTERVFFNAFLDACESLGVPKQPEVFLRLMEQNHAAVQTILRERLIGVTDLSAFETHWDELANKTMQRDGIALKPGVQELLAALHVHPKRMAVATSTRTPRALWKLKGHNITHFFAHIIGGDQVAKSKPAPDIYLHAANALGVAPARFLALEDSKNGVLAALAAGMTTIQIPDLIPRCNELRDAGALKMDSLLDLVKLVR